MVTIVTEEEQNVVSSPSSQKLSSLVNFQSDDYYSNYKRLATTLHATFPLLNEMSETDDQYLKSKEQPLKISDWGTNLLFLMDSYNTSASYLQVFNQFTTDYRDYN